MAIAITVIITIIIIIIIIITIIITITITITITIIIIVIIIIIIMGITITICSLKITTSCYTPEKEWKNKQNAKWYWEIELDKHASKYIRLLNKSKTIKKFTLFDTLYPFIYMAGHDKIGSEDGKYRPIFFIVGTRLPPFKMINDALLYLIKHMHATCESCTEYSVSINPLAKSGSGVLAIGTPCCMSGKFCPPIWAKS
ncbi:hypothetical protein RFI_21729 [Reticulomyxa filosa]|uniref:Uncharacterized protein n=1 Tax=Reticulomyxa filosa TaxID=46433 RepID=X6MRA1_RETFI|nr:hypothetical protein RFI_21729 [Reticulomyxa filosa]|eukprot:ETO15635.1 hypothetical protein RFI_21729 [Reticulomyxa filosa]